MKRKVNKQIDTLYPIEHQGLFTAEVQVIGLKRPFGLKKLVQLSLEKDT